MFTGLVQAMGTVQRILPSEAGARLIIDATCWDHTPALGDSVSISGCCLTVAPLTPDEPEGMLAFDAVRETLDKTTLGELRAGDPVNLEHAATPATLMGGHIVQGHVDGVARVTGVRADPGDYRIEVTPPPELMAFMAPKGSVTIDGVSLTIASLGADSIEIALIPTTLERTTLASLSAGDSVNIEADVIAKTVVHFLRTSGMPAPDGAE